MTSLSAVPPNIRHNKKRSLWKRYEKQRRVRKVKVAIPASFSGIKQLAYSSFPSSCEQPRFASLSQDTQYVVTRHLTSLIPIDWDASTSQL